MYNFLKDEQIVRSRDPERVAWSEEHRRDYLLPCDVALTESKDTDLSWLVLDTKESKFFNLVCMLKVYLVGTLGLLAESGTDTIRRVGTFAPDEDAGLERPDEPNHYRNTATENTVSFLRTHLEKIRSLNLLPLGLESGQEFLDFYHPLVCTKYFRTTQSWIMADWYSTIL